MRIKTLETAWNAHTPTYLHPYTKENLVWQLKLTAVVLVGIAAYEGWETYQESKRLKRFKSTNND